MSISVDSAAWALQLASCFYMAGVISVIQFIHYPSFAQIDRVQFSNFHFTHSNALGLVAGPAMCIELVSAVWIAKNGNPWLVVNACLVLFLWLVTFLISVPSHKRLATGFEEKAWLRLVRTNWLRTALWGFRAGAFCLLLAYFEASSSQSLLGAAFIQLNGR